MLFNHLHSDTMQPRRIPTGTLNSAWNRSRNELTQTLPQEVRKGRPVGKHHRSHKTKSQSDMHRPSQRTATASDPLRQAVAIEKYAFHDSDTSDEEMSHDNQQSTIYYQKEGMVPQSISHGRKDTTGSHAPSRTSFHCTQIPKLVRSVSVSSTTTVISPDTREIGIKEEER